MPPTRKRKMKAAQKAIQRKVLQKIAQKVEKIFVPENLGISGNPSHKASPVVEVIQVREKTYFTENILSHKWIDGKLWLEVSWKKSWELQEDLDQMPWTYEVIGSKVQNGNLIRYVEWDPTFEPEEKLREFQPEEDDDAAEDINSVIDQYVAEFVEAESDKKSHLEKPVAKNLKRGRVEQKRQFARKKAKI